MAPPSDAHKSAHSVHILCSARRKLGAKLPEMIIMSSGGQEEQQRPVIGNDSWLKGRFTAGEEVEGEELTQPG